MPKPYNEFSDIFIDPRTGRRTLEQGKLFIGDKNNTESPQDLTPDLIALGDGNILVGNEAGVAEESLALKDLISRFLTLRYELSLIEQNATFILQRVHPLLPKSQALEALPNGLMTNNNGNVAITALQEGQVFVGDENNQPQSTQTISVNNLPNLTYNRIWRGSIFNRPVESDGLSELELKVDELQLQVNEIETKVTSLQAAATELENWQIAAEAQIEEMLLEIGTLQSEVLALQTQVAALEASIVAIQAELATLGAAFSALQAEVSGLAATVSGLGLTVAGLSLTSISHGIQIGFLQSDLSSLRSDFNNATVTLAGDVIGAGLLSGAVIAKFAPDPVFTGHAMTLPSGDNTTRPSVLVPGMFRYNTMPTIH
jgi:hypothetical protein